MDKHQIYAEITEVLGIVPKFMQSIPESSLEMEWNLFKSLQLSEGTIPTKYRELIGVGISAATKCHYCTFFHTQVAKLHGATDEEIQSAVQYAKNSAGWSTYLNGMQVDFDEFKKEVHQIGTYLNEKGALKAA